MKQINKKITNTHTQAVHVSLITLIVVFSFVSSQNNTLKQNKKKRKKAFQSPLELEKFRFLLLLRRFLFLCRLVLVEIYLIYSLF